MMILNPPISEKPLEFDSEIYEILLDAHEKISKTKITELEVETSLIIARYWVNFYFWKDKLMNIILHTTQYDLKRLRRKEKGYLYLQLADIWGKAGFNRKKSWFLVLASQHLWNKPDYNDAKIMEKSKNNSL